MIDTHRRELARQHYIRVALVDDRYQRPEHLLAWARSMSLIADQMEGPFWTRLPCVNAYIGPGGQKDGGRDE